MPLTIFECKGIPALGRERFESAVVGIGPRDHHWSTRRRLLDYVPRTAWISFICRPEERGAVSGEFSLRVI